MKAVFRRAVVVLGLVCGPQVGLGAEASGGDRMSIQDLHLTVPAGWHLEQDARDQGAIILGFQNGDQYLQMYVKSAARLTMEQVFANNVSTVKPATTSSQFSLPWRTMTTKKVRGSEQRYVAGFMLERDGYTYFGYSSSPYQDTAELTATTFLSHFE